MGATVATHRAPFWRPVAWIALTLGLFLVLLLATAYLASRLTIEIGIADPEREHFALIQAILFAASLVVAVPVSGRLLGEGRWAWPGPMIVLPFLLAAAASYVIFADNRSGFYFETDHAIPEIFVPAGIALLATADLGRRSATTAMARRAWSMDRRRCGAGASRARRHDGEQSCQRPRRHERTRLAADLRGAGAGRRLRGRGCPASVQNTARVTLVSASCGSSVAQSGWPDEVGNTQHRPIVAGLFDRESEFPTPTR